MFLILDYSFDTIKMKKNAITNNYHKKKNWQLGKKKSTQKYLCSIFFSQK